MKAERPCLHGPSGSCDQCKRTPMVVCGQCGYRGTRVVADECPHHAKRVLDDVRVDRNGPVPAHATELGPCWLWTGGKQSQGYGMMWRDGRVLGAHKLAWIDENGPIPPNMNVLHRCDNPSCVRPEHLWLGTTRDNAVDRQAKGRGNRGDGSARAAGRSRPLLTITLSRDALERLDTIAESRGTTRSGAVEQLIRNARL